MDDVDEVVDLFRVALITILGYSPTNLVNDMEAVVQRFVYEYGYTPKQARWIYLTSMVQQLHKLCVRKLKESGLVIRDDGIIIKPGDVNAH